jgi:hypothetical protein
MIDSVQVLFLNEITQLNGVWFKDKAALKQMITKGIRMNKVENKNAC